MSSSHLTRINILYIEDDPINQMVLKNFLSLLGYKNVSIATTAQQGLDILDTSIPPIELIFMDLGLPDTNGIELTKKIRNGSLKVKNVPIIALTGNLSITAKEEALTAGMNGFLTKPTTPEELQTALDAALLKSVS